MMASRSSLSVSAQLRCMGCTGMVKYPSLIRLLRLPGYQARRMRPNLPRRHKGNFAARASPSPLLRGMLCVRTTMVVLRRETAGHEPMTELWRLTAREITAMLRRREVSPLDLIAAAEARIAAVDPFVNALPIRCFDRARSKASRIMDGGAGRKDDAGYLHGLPIVIKDLTAVEGVRWTEGSRVFADRIADRSDIVVETLEANGAIVIAKSNTPE